MGLLRGGRAPADPAAEIRRLGFRRWYERKLITGHLFLVSALLGITLIAVGLEAFGNPVAVMDYVARFGTALGGAALSVYAGTRYWQAIAVAERFGNHATCPHCDTYGLFDVLAAGAGAEDGQSVPKPGGWLRVRCRRCGTTWVM